LELQAGSNRPQYGQIKEVTRSEFVTEIDAVDPRSFVVVHLYEPYIKACQAMNRYLEVLAREQPTVKFIRMLSAEADQEDGYDHVALPTLMIYKAKDVSGNCSKVFRSLQQCVQKLMYCS
jgi:Phosducin